MCDKANLEDLNQCQEWEVGIGNILYIAYPETFTAIPVVPEVTSATTNEAAGTATGAFTAAANQGFVKLTVNNLNSKLEIKTEYDTNGACTTTIKGRLYPGKHLLGFMRKIKPQTQLFCVATKRNGPNLMLGHEGHPVYVKTYSLTESVTEAFADFEFELHDAAYVYEGTIPKKVVA